MKRNLPLTVVALALVSIASAGVMPSDRPVQAAKKDVVEIIIEDTQFKPDEVTIKKGQTVRWLNKDNRDHSILAKDQSFKSGNLRNGEKFEFTFKEAGTFDYICMLRPRMLGQIIVKEE